MQGVGETAGIRVKNRSTTIMILGPREPGPLDKRGKMIRHDLYDHSNEIGPPRQLTTGCATILAVTRRIHVSITDSGAVVYENHFVPIILRHL